MSESSDIAQAEPTVVAAEMARRQALEAMGIDVFVSRFDMPGAAPSVRQRLMVSETPPNSAPLNASAPKNTAGAQLTPPPLSNIPRSGARAASTSLSPSASSVSVDAPPSSVSSNKASEAVKFSMLLVSAGPFLWVEQLPDELIRQDQLALINAMARAISPQVLVRQQQFDWPVRGSTALTSDAESATQALQGLIQRMAREVNAKRVVVMGACPFLPDRIAQSAVIIPSTIAMLENALLKREAWKALKSLRAIEIS